MSESKSSKGLTRDGLYDQLLGSINSQYAEHPSGLAFIIAWSKAETAAKLAEVQQRAIQPELVYVLNLGGKEEGGVFQSLAC